MVGNTEVELGSDEEDEVTKGVEEVSSAVTEARERREKMQPFFQLARAPFHTPREKLQDEEEAGKGFRTPTWTARERARGFPGSARGSTSASARRGFGPASASSGSARLPRATPSGPGSASRTPRFTPRWGD